MFRICFIKESDCNFININGIVTDHDRYQNKKGEK